MDDTIFTLVCLIGCFACFIISIESEYETATIICGCTTIINLIILCSKVIVT